MPVRRGQIASALAAESTPRAEAKPADPSHEQAGGRIGASFLSPVSSHLFSNLLIILREVR